jgi:hypothetical protein
VLVVNDDAEKRIHLYRSGTRLLLAGLFPIAGVAAVFSKEILFLMDWKRSTCFKYCTITLIVLDRTGPEWRHAFPLCVAIGLWDDAFATKD